MKRRRTGESSRLRGSRLLVLPAALLVALATAAAAPAAAPSPDPSPSTGGSGGVQPDSFGPKPAAAPSTRRPTRTTAPAPARVRAPAAVVRPRLVAIPEPPSSSSAVRPAPASRPAASRLTPPVPPTPPTIVQPRPKPTGVLRDALGVRLPFAAPGDAPADGRALLVAGLGLCALVAASGGFLGLAVRYRRDLERA